MYLKKFTKKYLSLTFMALKFTNVYYAFNRIEQKLIKRKKHLNMGHINSTANQDQQRVFNKQIIESSLVKYQTPQDKLLNKDVGVTLQDYRSISKQNNLFPKDQSGQSFGPNGGQWFVQKIDNEGTQIVVRHYWDDMEQLQKYVSNSIKLHTFAQIKLFEQIMLQTEQLPFFSEMLIKEVKPLIKIQKKQLYAANSFQQIDFLIFVARILSSSHNIWIEPSYIYTFDDLNSFTLINYSTSKLETKSIFLGFVAWVFTEVQNFQECIIHGQQLASYDLPIYLKQLVKSILRKSSLSSYLSSIRTQLEKSRERMTLLGDNIDSFHACMLFNKVDKNLSLKKEWILAKKQNIVFFFNLKDYHYTKGKVIRKGRKIDIEDRCLVFDNEELSVKMMLQNTKFIVRAPDFELEEYSSMSDIEIVHKFPIKMHNPLIFQISPGNYYILENSVFKYEAAQNKIVQETKKIIDYIFFVQSKDYEYIVIRQSIDIFKNGIRIIMKGNQQVDLLLTGNPLVLNQISNIRVDIRNVDFCIEVYRGVFLMLAVKNFWILDLNFYCFFSFALPSRIKQFYGFATQSLGKNLLNSSNINMAMSSSNSTNATSFSSSCTSKYAFQIINQNFDVEFLSNHHGINVALFDRRLHMLGKIMGKLYYLNYKFEQKIGALRLIYYLPIFTNSPIIKAISETEESRFVNYQFSFSQPNLNFYKYQNWIYQGSVFIRVQDYQLSWKKQQKQNIYRIKMKIEQTQGSLRQCIQKMKQNGQKLSKAQTLMFLHRIMTIYRFLVVNQISHKAFSLKNFYFTKEKHLKLIGWSQPPRNQYISDFKDFLLVCFNIITFDTKIEKINDKILQSQHAEVNQYPAIYQSIVNSLKFSKSAQKKMEVEKGIVLIRQSLQKDISQFLAQSTQAVGNRYIFNFQYNTLRFNMVDVQTQKIKKMTLQFQQQSQQVTFKPNDKTAWNEKDGILYLLSANSNQFLELKIGADSQSGDKIKVQDYEYIPNNTIESSVIYIPDRGLYSFGGVMNQTKGKSVFCTNVYKFNWQKLMWDIDGQILEPRVNAIPVLSVCRKFVYLIGGQIRKGSNYLKLLCYDLQTKQCIQMIDRTISNPLLTLNQKNPLAVFHISKAYNIFLFWYMSNGNFNLRYVSSIKGGFDILVQTKHFSEQGEPLGDLSVTVQGKFIHLLRPYGKYTKLTVQKFQSLQNHSQTLYAI